MLSPNHCESSISLLYVEDDPDTRETIGSVICAKFPQLVLRSAENGKTGLKSFKDHPAEIVLTDVNMPVMNGIQMSRQIRALNGNVEIIAATAFSDSHYLMDAINAGIRRYVLKPVNFKLLFEALEDCIARITMQRQLRSQNELIRKLSRTVEQSPSMVLISDAAGAVEYVNARFSAVTGFAPEEVVGRDLRRIMTNASPVDLFQDAWNTITGGSEWRGEIINRKKDGELYCEEISISSLLGAEGEITNYVLVMEDISKRKRTEDALRESEYLIEQSQRASAIGSYKVFFGSGCWESSAALDRILGIGKSYARDLPGWLEIIHPDDQETMEQYLRGNIGNRRASFHMEFSIIRKSDGEIRKVSGLGKMSYDLEGNPDSMIGTIRDITERRSSQPRRKAGCVSQIGTNSRQLGRQGVEGGSSPARDRAERKRLEKALSESEQRFSALCEHAPIGIFRTDWEGNNIYSNSTWKEITGQSAAQAKGKGWLSAIHPDDSERLGQAWFKALLNGGHYLLEHRVITPLGKTVSVRSMASNVKGADGEILGFVGTLQNVSAKKPRASKTKKAPTAL
jgi:PAS domain S-box-containing protein